MNIGPVTSEYTIGDCRSVDPYGTGGTCPPIFMKGTSMVMSLPNILEVMSFRMLTRVTATVVRCILMQILCVVSQKKLQLLGDFVPQTTSLLLCPPNNPVRSTPLIAVYRPIWLHCIGLYRSPNHVTMRELCYPQNDALCSLVSVHYCVIKSHSQTWE